MSSIFEGARRRVSSIGKWDFFFGALSPLIFIFSMFSFILGSLKIGIFLLLLFLIIVIRLFYLTHTAE